MEFNSFRDKEITLKKIQKIPERLLLEELLTSSFVKKKKADRLEQWFSNLSEVSNPTGVMQAYIKPLIITRSGSRKF